MNILYLCHRFPFPPKRGGKIRPFNMVKHLSASGHAVTVASLVRSQAEAEEGHGIATHCEAYEMAPVKDAVQSLRMVARIPTPRPSSLAYFYSPALARRVRELLARGRYDLIFVHCSSAAGYVAHVEGVPKILDFGDMDSHKWRDYSRYRRFPLSAGYWLEANKLEREEKRLARRFDMCTATTIAEWQTLKGYDTGTETDWFPNGVDATYFSPGEQAYDPALISFVGRMDYYPNQECMLTFCATVWPRLRQHRPDLKLSIIGAAPSAAVRALAALPGVTVTGSVPDVRPYVRESALMVAPLNIARGTQNKILEAMAMGVPVVTSHVAAGGVDAVPGEHFLVAESPQQYVDAIVRLLHDREERARFAAAGRSRVLAHHDWKRSMQRLDGIIERSVRLFHERRGTRGSAGETVQGRMVREQEAV